MPHHGKIVLLLAILLFAVCSVAQVPVFKNYDVKNGLSSSTVYSVFQDRKGFMWFATSQGACRFDGTNFKNYSARDGLPDDEVFKIAEDSLGRLWMIGYNSHPCFLLDGKIHNYNNDSLLKNIDAYDQLFRNVNIDKQGRVWLLGTHIYLIDGNVVRQSRSPDSSTPTGVGYIDNQLMMTTAGGIYNVFIDKNFIKYTRGVPLEPTTDNSPYFIGNTCFITEQYSNKDAWLVKFGKHGMERINLAKFGIKNIIVGYLTYNETDSEVIISAGVKGLKAFNNNLTPLADPYPFLPGNIFFTSALFDKDSNTWITSLNKGVFFIPAHRTIQYSLNDKFRNSDATSVHIARNGDVYLGFDYSQYGVVSDGVLNQYNIADSREVENRIVRQCNWDDSTIILGADDGIYAINQNKPTVCKKVSSLYVKSLSNEGEDSVLVAGIDYAGRIIKTPKGIRLDEFWGLRTTAINKGKDGKIWLGCLKGLFIYANGRTKRFDKNAFINKSRITDIQCDELGNILVATHQNGLFVITVDSIYGINTSEGLPESNCNKLFIENDSTVWVCTGKNVSRIIYTVSKGFVFQISTLNGFWRNENLSVNDVAVDSTNIWVATNDGLFKIQKSYQQSASAPPVYITLFKSSDSVFINSNSPELRHFQNNIQVDFIGVSYTGIGTLYKYVLIGSSTDTFFTHNTTLNFNGLQAGNYSFEVWAQNSPGAWSSYPASISFKILPPLWKTWWFMALVIAFALGVVWMLFKWRVASIQNRERERGNIVKKIAEIELRALKSQMNEHFIFNSLASIQNFINQNNTEAANFYLTNFGTLIRRTMELSSSSDISLQDEIDYLDNYLTLEKMRFSKKFDYFIVNKITANAIAEVSFPSMLLQPYVENAIRHGLRYKEDGEGKLLISFTEENDYILCVIEDNGIGRQKANELKSKMHVEYQSRGTKLSEEKAHLFNLLHNQKIKIIVEDKIDSAGKGLGTLIRIYIPLDINL